MTPAPWKWERNADGSPVRLVSEAEEVHGHVLYISPEWVSIRGKERFLIASPADLAVIAQAAALLEALKRATNWIQHDFDGIVSSTPLGDAMVLAELRAAIAAAERTGP